MRFPCVHAVATTPAQRLGVPLRSFTDLMPRIGKGQKALDRALKHREDIERLLATTPPWALRGWFLDWAESQLRRDRFYLFSEDEHAVLAKELSSRMKPCEGWGGYTVDQLVRAALSYRADCSEEDDERGRISAAQQSLGCQSNRHESHAYHRRYATGLAVRRDVDARAVR